MAFARPLDYIDVAQRLREMREKYPDLTMQQVSMELREFAGKSWVIYTAAAYRTPDDPRPGIGTAWEPVPGPTPYTKDSEVQNAETAAWGRALVAIGADTRNGIASAEEVSNRSGNVQESTPVETKPAYYELGIKLTKEFSSKDARRKFVERALGRPLSEGIESLDLMDIETVESALQAHTAERLIKSMDPMAEAQEFLERQETKG